MKYAALLLLGTALSFGACKAPADSQADTQISTKIQLSTKPQATVSDGLVTVPRMAPTPPAASAMVAAANPLAVRAGLEILEQGGSAVDAAIAVQTVLGLVEPQSSGIAGGAFMVLYDNKSGEVWAYDGREMAPNDVKSNLFQDENGEPIKYFDGIASGKSTGTPGAMVMLHLAHQDYGKLPWGPQMEPGIQLAETGFAVTPRLYNAIDRMGGYALKNQKSAREYFFLEDGETPIPVGYVRDNPQYADALRALQANPRAMLEGPVAEAIIKVVREAPRPGTLSLTDMAKYQPKKKAALCSPYREYTVCGARPPSSGGVAVQSILGVLQNFDMSAMGPSLQGWHHFIEASFLGYADRDKYVGDEDFVNVPLKSLLNQDYLKSRAMMIKPGSAMVDVKAGDHGPSGQDATPDNPGTSHLTVVDKDGLTVSMTTTVEAVFGSQRMAHGFILNNQLTDFAFRSVDADGIPLANAVKAGKRPRSSMSPAIVFDNNKQFLMTSGSPGGNSIIAYTAKTIVGVLDWGLTPQAAAALPNVIARNGKVRLEENIMDSEIIDGLEALGHDVVRSQGERSGIHIIQKLPDGTLIGGADPRSEGVALRPQDVE